MNYLVPDNYSKEQRVKALQCIVERDAGGPNRDLWQGTLDAIEKFLVPGSDYRFEFSSNGVDWFPSLPTWELNGFYRAIEKDVSMKMGLSEDLRFLNLTDFTLVKMPSHPNVDGIIIVFDTGKVNLGDAVGLPGPGYRIRKLGSFQLHCISNRSLYDHIRNMLLRPNGIVDPIAVYRSWTKPEQPRPTLKQLAQKFEESFRKHYRPQHHFTKACITSKYILALEITAYGEIEKSLAAAAENYAKGIGAKHILPHFDTICADVSVVTGSGVRVTEIKCDAYIKLMFDCVLLENDR